MKRSEINQIIRAADEFISSLGYLLPPFAQWRPADWRANRAQAGEIIRARLGWDVTDYGRGRFDETGLLLFTVRNGNVADLARGRGMLYAEKIMISRRDQLSPMHFHEVKAEDIINRGGGELVVEVHHATPDGQLDRERPLEMRTDGIARTVAPGELIRLSPGESITLLPRVCHAFWAEGDDVLIGEVSTVNDDKTDNYFIEPVGRFPTVDEDEEPYRLIVGDYDRLLE